MRLQEKAMPRRIEQFNLCLVDLMAQDLPSIDSPAYFLSRTIS